MLFNKDTTKSKNKTSPRVREEICIDRGFIFRFYTLLV